MIRVANLALILLAAQAFVALTVCAQEFVLTETQQREAIKALNEAAKSTGADPLEIIRLGSEQIKTNQHSQSSDKTTGSAEAQPEGEEHSEKSPKEVIEQQEDDDDLGPGKLSEDSKPAYQDHRPSDSDNKSAQAHADPGDDDEDEFGIKDLFDEDKNHSSQKNIQPELAHKDDGSLMKQPSNREAKENPMDKESDFGLDRLFRDALESSHDHLSDQQPSLSSTVERDSPRDISNLVRPEDSIPEQNENLSESSTMAAPSAMPKQDDGENSINFEDSNKPVKQSEEPLELPSLDKPEARPIEESSVDSYIDTSDPNDPKKVHIERQIKSHVDPTGAVSHMHAETRTSSSLNNGNDSSEHYSKHSSISSASHSSSLSNNGWQPRNNNKNKNKAKNHTNNRVKTPNFPGIQPLAPVAPMAPMVFMPMMPYAAHPGPAAWANFNNPNQKMMKQQQQFPFAATYAGTPFPYFGATVDPYIDFAKAARRQAKNARRRANKEARRKVKAMAEQFKQ